MFYYSLFIIIFFHFFLYLFFCAVLFDKLLIAALSTSLCLSLALAMSCCLFPPLCLSLSHTLCGKDLGKYLRKWNAKSLTTFGCCLSVRCLPAVCLSLSLFLGGFNKHSDHERGREREESVRKTHTQVESMTRHSIYTCCLCPRQT